MKTLKKRIEALERRHTYEDPPPSEDDPVALAQWCYVRVVGNVPVSPQALGTAFRMWLGLVNSGKLDALIAEAKAQWGPIAWED